MSNHDGRLQWRRREGEDRSVRSAGAVRSQRAVIVGRVGNETAEVRGQRNRIAAAARSLRGGEDCAREPGVRPVGEACGRCLKVGIHIPTQRRGARRHIHRRIGRDCGHLKRGGGKALHGTLCGAHRVGCFHGEEIGRIRLQTAERLRHRHGTGPIADRCLRRALRARQPGVGGVEKLHLSFRATGHHLRLKRGSTGTHARGGERRHLWSGERRASHDAAIGGIADVDDAVAIHDQRIRVVETGGCPDPTRRASLQGHAADGRHLTRGRDPSDDIVRLFAHVDDSIRIQREPDGAEEARRPTGAIRAAVVDRQPGEDRHRASRGDLPDAVVVVGSHENVSARADLKPAGIGERRR